MFNRRELEEANAAKMSQMACDKALYQSAMDLLVRSDRYRYAYQFTWLGMPIIQLPQDILVTQEIFWRTQPDVVIETGIAWGGSVILHASLMELRGGAGRVVAVDQVLLPHIRERIMSYPFSHRIELLEGNSADPRIVAKVRGSVRTTERVAAFLDSNHTHSHVLAELHSYAPLVTVGQYLTVYATAIEQIPASRPRPWGLGNNPWTAVEAFCKEDDRFTIDVDVDVKVLGSFAPRGRLRRVS